MIFETILNLLGYYKKQKVPTFHEFVETKQKKVDYIRTQIEPVIRACVESFINDGVIFREVMTRVYNNRNSLCGFDFYYTRFEGDDKNKKYKYELCPCELRFKINKKYRLRDFDHYQTERKIMDELLKPYGLKTEEGFITVINEEDKNKALYCSMVMDD